YEPEAFSPQRATRQLLALAREARLFGKGEDPWRDVRGHADERRTALALELLAAKTFALVASPIIPDMAEHLFRELGYPERPSEHGWSAKPAWVPSGQRIGDLGAICFPAVTQALAPRQSAA